MNQQELIEAGFNATYSETRKFTDRDAAVAWGQKMQREATQFNVSGRMEMFQKHSGRIIKVWWNYLEL